MLSAFSFLHVLEESLIDISGHRYNVETWNVFVNLRELSFLL